MTNENNGRKPDDDDGQKIEWRKSSKPDLSGCVIAVIMLALTFFFIVALCARH